MAHGWALDALTLRVEACERSDHKATDLIAMRVDIVGLRCDMEELKSLDICMFYGWVDILESSSSNVLDVSKIPLTIMIGDVALVVDGYKSDASEADEKDLVTREEAVYKELKDLKGDLVQLATEASLRDISMIGPIGS